MPADPTPPVPYHEYTDHVSGEMVRVYYRLRPDGREEYVPAPAPVTDPAPDPRGPTPCSAT